MPPGKANSDPEPPPMDRPRLCPPFARRAGLSGGDDAPTPSSAGTDAPAESRSSAEACGVRNAPARAKRAPLSPSSPLAAAVSPPAFSIAPTWVASPSSPAASTLVLPVVFASGFSSTSRCGSFCGIPNRRPDPSRSIPVSSKCGVRGIWGRWLPSSMGVDVREGKSSCVELVGSWPSASNWAYCCSSAGPCVACPRLLSEARDLLIVVCCTGAILPRCTLFLSACGSG